MAITTKSVEVTQWENQKAGYAPLRSDQLQGRVRVASFNFTGVGSFALNVGQKAALVRLPPKARVVQVYFATPSNSALGGTTQVLDFGYETTDGSSSGQSVFGTMTVAMGPSSGIEIRQAVGSFEPDLSGKEIYITATCRSANISVDGATGFVLYVID